MEEVILKCLDCGYEFDPRTPNGICPKCRSGFTALRAVCQAHNGYAYPFDTGCPLCQIEADGYEIKIMDDGYSIKKERNV